MELNLSHQAAGYRRRRKQISVRKKITMILASVVVFCTTYALILPAITMEQAAICGKEEHLHDETCYTVAPSVAVTQLFCDRDALALHSHDESCLNETGLPVCGYADFVLHRHDAVCYDGDGRLQCPLPEIEAHTHGASCWQQPHIHSDGCYTSVQGELLCAMMEGEIHAHLEGCYTSRQALICTQPEVVGHTHGDACRTVTSTLTCQLTEEEAHAHDDACLDENGALVCVRPVTTGHAHNDACYETTETVTCALPEQEGHTHGDGCYQTVYDLTCALSDTEPHVHGSACYLWTPQLTCQERTAEDGAQPILICAQEEIVAHTHQDSCFADGALTCGLTEVLTHVHSADDCYQIIVQDSQQQVLSCGMEEHSHEESCYPVEDTKNESFVGDGFIDIRYCGIAAHSHGELCYDANGVQLCTMMVHEHDWRCDLLPSDPTAVETPEDWEADLPDLQGNMAADLIAVAESQLGYEQVEENYIIQGDEQLFYSRYADWWSYGNNPYGDWNAKFVDFCLDYAGITSVPLEPETATWPTMLEYYDQWQDNDGNFSPIPADLAFFDTHNDGEADRAGIITVVNESEGTFDAILERYGMVQKVTYDLSDSDIMGYARIPGNESAAVEAVVTEDVQRVIDLIDALPTYDEIYTQLDAYYEAGDEEGEEAYYTVVVQQVNDVYFAYSILSEEEKSAVTNADKLMALENIWSAEILIDEITSDKPTTVDFESTKDFITLNLYDYGSNINTKWKSNNEWPGFQWNGGAYMKSTTFSRTAVDNIDFGNSMITDFDYGSSGTSVTSGKSSNSTDVVNQGGLINTKNDIYTNTAIGVSTGTPVMAGKLSAGGYPMVKNITSDTLYWLFQDGTYAKKKNTANIDGLFQKNEETGEYYYDSRDNHAQYGNNRFTLYKQIITPNFIIYPFGNFLPLNDITSGSNATQVSKITNIGTYVQQVINDLWYNSSFRNQSTGAWYDKTAEQLVEMLARYRTNLQNDGYWSSWNAKQIIQEYLTAQSFSGTLTDSLLKNLYNIDWDVDSNFFFGMEMRMNFMQPKDGMTGTNNAHPMTFYFAGDDDVWVYIDNTLFLDLSGIHRHVGGDIDFVNGKVNYYKFKTYVDGEITSTPEVTLTFAEILKTYGGIAEADLGKYLKKDANGNYTTFLDYSTHKFDFFYMERGSGSSVCRINFNFPLLRQNTLSVGKELTDDSDSVEALGNPDFMFQVLDADTNGLFIPAGWAYSLYDVDGSLLQEIVVSSKYSDGRVKSMTIKDANGTALCVENYDANGNLTSRSGSGQDKVLRTNENGIFTLKAGQRAEFVGIPESAGKYYVRELLDNLDLTQYEEITVSGVAAIKESVNIGDTNFTGLKSPILDMNSGSSTFRFNNKINTKKLGSLRIEKQLIKVDDFVQLLSLEDPTFNMTVTLDGFRLPVGTTYTVYYSDGTTANKNVTTAGVVIVPAGGYVLIDNILAGTEYTVTEQDDGIYYITYQYPDENDQTTTSTDKASGIVAVDTQVEILVVNSEVSVKGELTVNKTVVNPDSTARDYTFQIVQVDDANEPVEGGLNETITMSDVTNTGSASFQLGYAEADIEPFPATYYYRITEVNDKEDVLDNTQIFLAKVTVEKADGKLNAQVANLWSYTTDESGALIKDKVSSITFQNTLVGSLTLSKEVVGTTPEGGFTFCITLTDGSGQPVTGRFPAIIYQQSGEEIATTRTFDANGINLVEGVMDGESITIYDIPCGTTWTIEEINADGYVVTYKVNDGESKSGAHSTGSITVGSTEVVFTNSAMYELPETGGGGVAKILICGGLLTIMPCLWLLRRQRYRGRRVNGG